MRDYQTKLSNTAAYISKALEICFATKRNEEYWLSSDVAVASSLKQVRF